MKTPLTAVHRQRRLALQFRIEITEQNHFALEAIQTAFL